MKRWLASVVFILLLSPDLAFAQAGGEGGMPQLDFANRLTTSQVVWMGIIFLGLYLLLTYWALPQVKSVLESRSERIDADLTAAQKTKEQADEATREMQKAVRDAQAKAQSAIAGAIADAKADAELKAKALNEALNAQLVEAEARIAAARTSAMAALSQVAAETTSLIIERLAGGGVKKETIEDAVGVALAERKRK